MSSSLPSPDPPPQSVGEVCGVQTQHPETQHPETQGLLADLELELNRLQRSIRIAIQTQLAKLSGRSMGSLGENRELAATIHRLLESHGLRVQCIECGHPAILRVSPRGGSGCGAFVFDHSIDGRRTFHGGKGTVPEIRLVAKPPRKKRRD